MRQLIPRLDGPFARYQASLVVRSSVVRQEVDHARDCHSRFPSSQGSLLAPGVTSLTAQSVAAPAAREEGSERALFSFSEPQT